MMKSLLILVGAGALAGCSVTLPVQGRLQDSLETFTGTATAYMDGGGVMTLNSEKTQCSGNFVHITSREGEGVMKCSDNRQGPFKFATTGSRGTGQGTLTGEPYTFTFGK